MECVVWLADDTKLNREIPEIDPRGLLKPMRGQLGIRFRFALTEPDASQDVLISSILFSFQLWRRCVCIR